MAGVPRYSLQAIFTHGSKFTLIQKLIRTCSIMCSFSSLRAVALGVFDTWAIVTTPFNAHAGDSKNNFNYFLHNKKTTISSYLKSPEIWTRDGSNGVPLKGEPSAFQAFFSISWAFWKDKTQSMNERWFSWNGPTVTSIPGHLAGTAYIIESCNKQTTRWAQSARIMICTWAI